MEYKRVDVAYACKPSTSIDHILLHFMIDFNDRPDLTIVGSKCDNTTRGNPRNKGFMKNATVLDCILHTRTGDKDISVKVFKNYLHFCQGLNVALCEKIAKCLEKRFSDINNNLNDIEWVSNHFEEMRRDISTTDNNKTNLIKIIKNDEKVLVVDEYLTYRERFLQSIKQGKRIYKNDLEFGKVTATMSNSKLSVGYMVNCNRMVTDIVNILDEMKDGKEYRIYYDNAISTNIFIRIIIPDIKPIKYTIYQTGTLSWSSYDIPEVHTQIETMFLELCKKHKL